MKMKIIVERNIMMSKKDYHSLDKTSLKVSKHEQEKCFSSILFFHWNFYSPFMSNHSDDDG